MKILLVEDDAETASFVLEGLRKQGYVAEHSATGQEGFFSATSGDYSLLIIDRMLPGLDGLRLAKMLRAAKFDTPILFLTTMSGIDDRVEGLAAGGDDYLVKPFAFAELLARIEALVRRAFRTDSDPQPTTLHLGELDIDLLRRVVTRAGQQINLYPQEFKLLEYLVRHAGRVVTRTMLLENVWGIHFEPHTNIIDTHISSLRSKVDRGFATEMIRTVRGSGYIIRED